MWVKQCHKPPMTGNGKFIPSMKMVMTGECLLFYPQWWSMDRNGTLQKEKASWFINHIIIYQRAYFEWSKTNFANYGGPPCREFIHEACGLNHENEKTMSWVYMAMGQN